MNRDHYWRLDFHLLISQHSTVSNENRHLSNTLRPRQNGRHFADDTFNRIFVNENVRISMKFSLKFVPKGPVKNIPALVQKMTWRRLGDKPLSEPVMVSSPTHICVIRPQWVKLCILSYLLAWYFIGMVLEKEVWFQNVQHTHVYGQSTCDTKFTTCFLYRQNIFCYSRKKFPTSAGF